MTVGAGFVRRSTRAPVHAGAFFVWTPRCGGFRVSGQKHRSLRGSSASRSGAGAVSPGQLRPLCFLRARCCVNHGVFGQKSGSSRGARRPALSAPALLSSCSAPFRLEPHRTRLAPPHPRAPTPAFRFRSVPPSCLASPHIASAAPRPRVEPAASLALPSLRPASPRCPPRASHPLAPTFSSRLPIPPPSIPHTFDDFATRRRPSCPSPTGVRPHFPRWASAAALAVAGEGLSDACPGCLCVAKSSKVCRNPVRPRQPRRLRRMMVPSTMRGNEQGVDFCS